MGWILSKALMNSLYSQERVVESLAVTFSDGEQYAQSNSSHTHAGYLCNVKTTGFSRLSRFGMTFGHLTDDRGAELLTLYREGFPVRTSASQVKAAGLKEIGQVSGWKWPGSWAKYDPVSCSWKTRQCSLLEDSTEFSETFPRWGMTVDGELFPLPTLVRRISEKESGYMARALIPTPTSSDPQLERRANHGDQFVTSTGSVRRMNENGTTSFLGLAGYVRAWTTQTAHMAKQTNAPSESERNTPTLAAQVGGSLNPTWVEWLMGWPEGWTDLKPLEMDKFRQWLDSHGKS
jgi:hypothetical protein